MSITRFESGRLTSIAFSFVALLVLFVSDDQATASDRAELLDFPATIEGRIATIPADYALPSGSNARPVDTGAIRIEHHAVNVGTDSENISMHGKPLSGYVPARTVLVLFHNDSQGAGDQQYYENRGLVVVYLPQDRMPLLLAALADDGVTTVFFKLDPSDRTKVKKFQVISHH